MRTAVKSRTARSRCTSSGTSRRRRACIVRASGCPLRWRSRRGIDTLLEHYRSSQPPTTEEVPHVARRRYAIPRHPGFLGPRIRFNAEQARCCCWPSAGGQQPSSLGQTRRHWRIGSLSAGYRQLLEAALHELLKPAHITQRRTQHPRLMSSASMEACATLDDGNSSKAPGSVNEYPWIEIVERAHWILECSRTVAAGLCSSFSSMCISYDKGGRSTYVPSDNIQAPGRASAPSRFRIIPPKDPVSIRQALVFGAAGLVGSQQCGN